MAITKGNNQARRQENHLTIDVKMIKILFENKKKWRSIFREQKKL